MEMMQWYIVALSAHANSIMPHYPNFYRIRAEETLLNEEAWLMDWQQ